MKNLKDDRRSLRTRNLLHNALIELMLEKPYDDITVQDIIDRANVGRSTFYGHFQDKEDLAVSGLEHALGQLGHPFEGRDFGEHAYISAMLRHVQEQQALFQALIRGRGIDLFLEKGQAFWSKKIEAHLRENLPQGQEPEVPLAIIVDYLSSALITMVKWWVDHKMPYSPERMEEIFLRLVMPGVLSVLGQPVEHVDADHNLPASGASLAEGKRGAG